MTIIIKLISGILNLIYALMKIASPEDKVTIISRQSDMPTEDIKMLAAELNKRGGVQVVCLCRKIPDGIAGKIGYCFHVLTQMKHMASSKVVVLDGYCIAVSLLHHRESLKVVQMWHALGSLKKFGYSILDRGEGSSRKLASLMHMHRNYDVIITSSTECRKNFAEAFNYPESQFVVESLPRVDAIKDANRQGELRRRIIQQYPQLADKENIVYAPTFRKNEAEHIQAIKELIAAVDKDRYNLIIKVHPLTKFEYEDDGIVVDYKFSSLDMFAVADYLVLDYSAIVYEGALMNKPMYFYAFDIDKYKNMRDFYIDYEREIPGLVVKDSRDLMTAIQSGEWDAGKVSDFASKYVQVQENCTQRIANIITGFVQEG